MAARNVSETLRPKPATGQTLKRCASRLGLKAPLHGPLASVPTPDAFETLLRRAVEQPHQSKVNGPDPGE
jgi:hypothetical protein